MKNEAERNAMETEELTAMQRALLKVLVCMPLQKEDKILIMLTLTKDEHIYVFLKWLQAEIPEEQIKPRMDEIIAKAVEISRTK